MVWTHAQNISTQTRRRMDWLKKKKTFLFCENNVSNALSMIFYTDIKHTHKLDHMYWHGCDGH